MRSESNPISDETMEKRWLRRHYSQNKNRAVNTCINQLQKQVKEELKIESLVSWEKFCNSVSLETNSNESWRKIKNFLEPKGQCDYPTLRLANEVAKTNADKVQLFAESVENIKWAFWDKHALQAAHAHKFTGKHINKIFTIHVIIQMIRDRDKCKLANASSLLLYRYHKSTDPQIRSRCYHSRAFSHPGLVCAYI